MAGPRLTIQEVGPALELLLARRIIIAALTIKAAWQRDSEVDTGFYRANTQITAGAPPAGMIGVRGAGVPSSPAHTEAALLGSYRIEQGKVYIGNRTSYARFLGSARRLPETVRSALAGMGGGR